MKDRIENIGFLKGVALLFAIGFLLGVGLFLGFKEKLAEYSNQFYNNVIENITNYEIEYKVLLKNVIQTEFRSFFLLLLFGISILSIPALIVFPIYKGFIGGFLLSSMFCKFSWKALLIGSLYGFPQILFYLPVMVSVLHKNYYMGIHGLKKKLFLEQLPSIAVLAFILLAGCVSEAYINARIMRYILSAIL